MKVFVHDGLSFFFWNFNRIGCCHYSRYRNNSTYFYPLFSKTTEDWGRVSVSVIGVVPVKGWSYTRVVFPVTVSCVYVTPIHDGMSSLSTPDRRTVTSSLVSTSTIRLFSFPVPPGPDTDSIEITGMTIFWFSWLSSDPRHRVQTIGSQKSPTPLS